VETGTAHGGSALCLATLCEATGHGEVVSVDIGEWPDRPRHPRLTYLTASSTDPAAVERVAQRARGARTVLVVLDSDHRRDHVLAELYAYAPLVTPAATWSSRTPTSTATPSTRSSAPADGGGRGLPQGPRRLRRRPDQGELLFTFNPRGWLRKLR
jgi:Cephalosporin hydroxylase